MRKFAYAIAVLAFGLAGCQQVAVTGRQQLNFLPDAQVSAMADQSFAQFMSEARKADAVLRGGESPNGDATLDMVRRVSQRIVAAAGLERQRQWEFVVVKSKAVNAFAMPNGKIVVFTGLLPVSQNEPGLAAVIGHEVGHVVAHHGAERVSQTLLINAALNAADAATRNSKNHAKIALALGIGAQYGLLLPFSREHESEADHLGVLFMAKAGYDPAEAIGLWERMEASSSARSQWEFISTHPNPSTRRAQIRDWLPEARVLYADQGRPLPKDAVELAALRNEGAADPQGKVAALTAAAAAAAPAALEPVWRDGAWYRVKYSDKPEPVRVEFSSAPCEAGVCKIITGDDRSVRRYDSRYGMIEYRQESGLVTQFSPPVTALRWPLRVGDSWVAKTTAKTSTGRTVALDHNFDVVAYESVTVPGGTYDAYKMVETINGTRVADLWYSAEVEYYIKSVLYDAKGNRGRVAEMVEFHKASSLEADR